MKKSYVSYDTLVDYNKILDSYRLVVKNTEHKEKLFKYNLFLSSNLVSIYNSLKDFKYHHGKYNIFLIKDPKYRVIMSENLTDKIVNQMISEYILKPILEPKLIDSNVATRKGMGSSYAFNLCKKYINNLKRKGKEVYVLKFDIKKYFYNIDHDILIERLDKIYEDKRIVSLLKDIIYSSNMGYVNREIDNIINRELKKDLSIKHKDELKRVPRYNYHKGLAIGNVTSQILAIFYLNRIDHLIKEKLGCKYYIRYMDDGVIFDYDKERLKYIKSVIEKELVKEKLELNKKTNIYKLSSGFTFIGYRFILKNNKLVIRINNKVKTRIKRKIKYLDLHDKEKLVRVKASYYGYMMRASTNYLQYKFKIKS